MDNNDLVNALASMTNEEKQAFIQKHIDAGPTHSPDSFDEQEPQYMPKPDVQPVAAPVVDRSIGRASRLGEIASVHGRNKLHKTQPDVRYKHSAARGGFNNSELANRWAEVRSFTNSELGIPD